MPRDNWDKYKKFNGIEYHVVSVYHQSASKRAYEEAQNLRRRGHKARVVVDKTEKHYTHAVYVR